MKDHFPLWIRAIHLVNCTTFMSMALKLILQFLNARVRGMIVVHDTLDQFHSHVEREILPFELGGNNGLLDNQGNINELLSKSDYFQALEKYIFGD